MKCIFSYTLLVYDVGSRAMTDVSQLLNYLHSHVAGGQKKLSRQSVFSLRTEEGSAKQYFQFYGFLSQQQNMMLVSI